MGCDKTSKKGKEQCFNWENLQLNDLWLKAWGEGETKCRSSSARKEQKAVEKPTDQQKEEKKSTRKKTEVKAEKTSTRIKKEAA